MCEQPADLSFIGDLLGKGCSSGSRRDICLSQCDFASRLFAVAFSLASISTMVVAHHSRFICVISDQIFVEGYDCDVMLISDQHDLIKNITAIGFYRHDINVLMTR